MKCEVMNKHHYKSDFELALPIRDMSGAEVLFPDFDWTARFWTSSAAIKYTAASKGGRLHNAYVDSEGRVHVVFDHHGLTPGQLTGELTCEFPNATYLDGFQREVCRIDTDLCLTCDKCDFGEILVHAALGAVIRTAAESEAEVFGGVIDKVNKLLEKALEGEMNSGNGGQRAVGTVAGPQVLQRGMISIGAKEGVVYRNCGYIRVPLKLVSGNCDIDLSGVDMNHVIDVECCGPSPTIMASGDLYVDSESNKLVVRGYRNDKRWSIRLKVRRGEDAEYIMRCPDGKIRPTNMGYKPVEVLPPKPFVERKIFCGDIEYPGEYLPKVFSESEIARLEIQRKCKMRLSKAKRDNDEGKWQKQPRWHKCDSYKVGKDGVYRIRFMSTSRSPVSDWTVFTISRRRGDIRYVSVKPL